MNKFTIACLRVLSMLMIPVGILLFIIAQASVRPGIPPVQAFLLVFFGFLGNVVCDMADEMASKSR